MIDFHSFLEEMPFEGSGQAYNPYAAKWNGEWLEGTISIDFLDDNFGQYGTANEMKNATSSEGLKSYFDYLVEQGKIPA
jgi:hypothetical protein